MSGKAKFLIISLMGLFFLYGYLFGVYKIFPFNQLMQAKHYIEQSFDLFESETVIKAESLITFETLLQRLFIKKIYIDEDIRHGGGISSINNYLYIITNKGKLIALDIDNHKRLDTDINKLKLNYNQLIASGHPYEHDFRHFWLRVNGLYAEKLNENRHILYASHQKFDREGDCFRFTIDKITLNIQDDLVRQSSGWETLFAAEPCIKMVPEEYLEEFPPYVGNVSGGKMIPFDENRLLVSVGDFDRHALKDGIEEYAQDDTVPYGKFILVDKTSGKWTVFTKGNRNPLGLIRDNNGTIWSTENGPKGGDELNIIEQGNNYGWPRVSYGLWYYYNYSLSDDSIRGHHNNYTKPVYSWIPSIATSNLIRIEGDKFKNWQNDIIVSSLKNQSLRRLRISDQNTVIYDERIELGHRIRDINILNNDLISLITDDGYLVLIDDGGVTYRDPDDEESSRIAYLNKFDRIASDYTQDKLTAEVLFQQKCSSCHNMEPENGLGPHLANLWDREIGGAVNFNYSSALTSETSGWTEDKLTAFLENPGNIFPGSDMEKVTLNKSEIDSLVKYLKYYGN